MANRHRGEIAARLDGRERTLCLTLGALAELEASFGAGDLVALAERFEGGRLSARDIVKIIGCGLRGAGEAVSDEEVAAMRAEGGAAGFAMVAAELIRATFGTEAAAEGEGGGKPSATAEPLRWDELMGLAFGVLRLSPAAFWSMTLQEIAAAMKAVLADEETSFGRAAMGELMRRFPDG